MVYFLFRPKNKEVPIRKNICRRVKDKVSNTLLRDEHNHLRMQGFGAWQV